MDSDLRRLDTTHFPELLKEMSDPPQKLYVRGTLPDRENVFLCVVGSRKASEYGKKVCSKIISGLSGSRVVVVSGLALGIDAEAHKAAVESGLPTVAVPGSGLKYNVIYPKSHLSLAKNIIKSGGCLLSEFEPDFEATSWSFPKRNRVMAGISHGILLIEAEDRSGTLITARLGLEYNREVMAVPGSVFSSTSVGTNRMIKEGAYPVTSSKDVIEILSPSKKVDDKREETPSNLSADEQILLKKLKEPMSKNELISSTDLPTARANMTISSLEIKGHISEAGGVLFPVEKTD